ncbi:SOS response-associated peptidase [Xanthovirga aplysinae]|uniref:SOS response-associated peptidase n=1 Tax=Xanthovirga aplysinae TaxID=2529853 RepID=UPI0012BD13D1|nr:SOS response-associated peptidase [Xanthovirga aplysinae]MTI31793.1 SOS response-associated peptidase [Xanthovirga aplysinae]
MCFHYALQVEAQQIENRYQAHFSVPEEFHKFYYTNAYDHRPLPIITNETPELIQNFFWGLIPYWVKDRESALELWSKTLNARSETAFEKPSFRHGIRYQRCLIPCTGFYEWHTYQKKKYPYFLYLKGKPIFSLAGIWESWIEKKSGKKVNTFSVLTTEANSLVAKIHNEKKRMPVILTVENEKRWLSSSSSKEETFSLLSPLEDQKMEAHSISKLITSRKDNPNQESVQKPFHYKELDIPDTLP